MHGFLIRQMLVIVPAPRQSQDGRCPHDRRRSRAGSRMLLLASSVCEFVVEAKAGSDTDDFVLLARTPAERLRLEGLNPCTLPHYHRLIGLAA